MRKNSVILFVLLIVGGLSSVYSSEKKSENDTIHVVGHAHMDMNWKWTYPETIKMSNDNLRQTVAFMDEYKDFTMVQSQAAIYNQVEKIDPLLFEKIKKYVKEGRLEPVGGMWVEGDSNLSSGEAYARSFLIGQRYFLSRFGKMAKVGWLPDNFGHISQLPQILKLANCDYFYFHRCKPYLGTFWWKGSDSSTVLCYANNTYNGRIDEDLKNELLSIVPGKHRILQITGVGDHGGGPTRDDINMVHKLNETKGYPAVKFATAGDFFEKVSKEMDGRPTHIGEMQFIFEGCYTTVTGVKQGNRNSEANLFSAEYLSSLRWLAGESYPLKELDELWRNVAFNQFHDILCGSAIHEANQDAIAEYNYVNTKVTEIRDFAFRRLADEIHFQKGLGQPVVAVNLQPYQRKALVIAEIYAYEQPVTTNLSRYGKFYDADNVNPVDIGQGAFPSVLVKDGEGNSYTGQIIWGKSTPPGYRFRIEFLAELPAGGYKTFYIDPNKPAINNESIQKVENQFETDFFKITINPEDGEIIKLFDKRTNTEYASSNGLHKLRIYTEEAQKQPGINGTSAWNIGKIVKTEDITDFGKVKVVEQGPVRACIQSEKHWGNSKIIQRTYIYKSYPRIDYDLEIHWFEQGGVGIPAPMLRAVFPLALKDVTFNCQVPFDVVDRPVNGQECPAQRWVDITDGKVGMALLNKTQYGHSYTDGELRLTLMRSPGYPDEYPNLGKFHMQYALFPHKGDWKNSVWNEGDDFNVPVYAAEPPSLALGTFHASRPEESTLIKIDSDGIILSGIKKAEDSEELIIRMAEIEGDEKILTLSLPNAIATARKLNLIELPITDGENVNIEGQSLSMKIKPHEILTLGIKLVK